MATLRTCIVEVKKNKISPFCNDEKFALVAIPSEKPTSFAAEVAIRALAHESGYDILDVGEVSDYIAGTHDLSLPSTIEDQGAAAAIQWVALEAFVSHTLSAMDILVNNPTVGKPRMYDSILVDPVTVVKVLDIALTQYSCAATRKAYNTAWNNAQNTYGLNAAEKTKKVATLFGFNLSQKDAEQPLNTVQYSQLVSAVQEKLDALQWPCVLKTGILSDMRLLPYARNSYTWEITPGLHDSVNIRVYKTGKIE